MVNIVHHRVHELAVDLNDHPIKEVAEAQLLGILQHGLELEGDDLRISEFAVGDDTDVRIFFHEQQKILEGEGGVLLQDGAVEKGL